MCRTNNQQIVLKLEDYDLYNPGTVLAPGVQYQVAIMQNAEYDDRTCENLRKYDMYDTAYCTWYKYTTSSREC